MKKYTFRDWWDDHKGMAWFSLTTTYADIYPWYSVHRYKAYGLLREAWYFLKCKVWHHYNSVTADTLSPTWCDVTHKLIYINFEMLRSVVEDEGWFSHWAFAPEEWGEAQDDMQNYWRERMGECQEVATLYDWWTNVRPTRDDPTKWWIAQCAAEGVPTDFNFEAIDDNPGFSRMAWRGTLEQQARCHELNRQSHLIEQHQDEEDTAMLHRLIDIRGTLWT